MRHLLFLLHQFIFNPQGLGIFFYALNQKESNNFVTCCYAADFLRLLLCSLSLQSSILFSCLFLFLRPSVWLWRINRFRSVSWIWLRAFAPLTSPPSLSFSHSKTQWQVVENTRNALFLGIFFSLFFFLLLPLPDSFSFYSPHSQPSIFNRRFKARKCGTMRIVRMKFQS